MTKTPAIPAAIGTISSVNERPTNYSRKINISGQIINIKSNEEQYSNSLKNYADALYGTKEKLEIISAKLASIYKTKSETISGSEEVGARERELSKITSDISKTENEISKVNTRISDFIGLYGENATSTPALKLFGEFENKIAEAVSPEEIETTKEGYCYFYEETDKTGKICGLFGATASKEKETYKTHNEKEVKEISKEASETEIK